MILFFNSINTSQEPIPLSCPNATSTVVTVGSEQTNKDYVAFGLFLSINNNGTIYQYERDGYNHTEEGVYIRRVIDRETATVLSEDIVFTPPLNTDVRFGCVWHNGSKIFIRTAMVYDRYGANEEWFYKTLESTDNLIGLNFIETKSDIISPLSGNYYGYPNYWSGGYWMSYYNRDATVTDNQVYLEKRDANNNILSTYTIYDGSDYYNETTVIGVGNNIIALSRRDNSPTFGFWANISVDGGYTWSGYTNTLLTPQTEKTHGILRFSNSGLVNLIFTNRDNSIGKTYISQNNVLTDLISDPTNWNTPIEVGSDYGQLGHPDFIELCDDTFLIKYSTENSTTETRVTTQIVKT